MPGISNKSEFGYVSLNSGMVTIRIGEDRGVVSLDLNVIESLAVMISSQQEVYLLLYFKSYATTTVLALTKQCAAPLGMLLDKCLKCVKYPHVVGNKKSTRARLFGVKPKPQAKPELKQVKQMSNNEVPAWHLPPMPPQEMDLSGNYKEALNDIRPFLPPNMYPVSQIDQRVLKAPETNEDAILKENCVNLENYVWSHFPPNHQVRQFKHLLFHVNRGVLDNFNFPSLSHRPRNPVQNTHVTIDSFSPSEFTMIVGGAVISFRWPEVSAICVSQGIFAVIVLKDRVYNTHDFQISGVEAGYFCGKLIQSFNVARNAGWI